MAVNKSITGALQGKKASGWMPSAFTRAGKKWHPQHKKELPTKVCWLFNNLLQITIQAFTDCVLQKTNLKFQEPTESGNTGPRLADNQSRDLNKKFWLVGSCKVLTVILTSQDSDPGTRPISPLVYSPRTHPLHCPPAPGKRFSKQPIRTRYLGHVTIYQPIRDQYFLLFQWEIGNSVSDSWCW